MVKIDFVYVYIENIYLYIDKIYKKDIILLEIAQ